MAILSPVMSFPADHKSSQEQHIVLMDDSTNQIATTPPPRYQGGSSPCRFKGGRRGGGHCRGRRCAKMSFMQRFALRFVTYFILATLYVNRVAISSLIQNVIQIIGSYLPNFISSAWTTFKNVADIPFGISTIVGLLFYSAIASLAITSLRARIMQKRRLRFQQWMKNNNNNNNGEYRAHRFPSHIHRHEELEKGEQYKDDEKSGEELSA